MIHLEKMLQSYNTFLKVKIASLILAERYLASALFLDIITLFWRWRRWLCCWAIFKAVTAWSCNNSKAPVKTLERHEINRFLQIDYLRSSIFFKKEKLRIEKNLLLSLCFKLQNWLLTWSEGEMKYTRSGVKWNTRVT